MASTEVKWIEGLEFVAETGSKHAVVLDGPDNVGARPMEMILVGLAGCTGMDVISILKKKRQHVIDFRVRVEGKKADEHPKVYTEIQIEYIVKGSGVKEEAVRRAIELSETTYCPVMAMLRKTAKITTSFRVLEDEIR